MEAFWLFFWLGGWEVSAVFLGVAGLIILSLLERRSHDR